MKLENLGYVMEAVNRLTKLRGHYQALDKFIAEKSTNLDITLNPGAMEYHNISIDSPAIARAAIEIISVELSKVETELKNFGVVL